MRDWLNGSGEVVGSGRLRVQVPQVRSQLRPPTPDAFMGQQEAAGLQQAPNTAWSGGPKALPPALEGVGSLFFLPQNATCTALRPVRGCWARLGPPRGAATPWARQAAVHWRLATCMVVPGCFNKMLVLVQVK